MTWDTEFRQQNDPGWIGPPGGATDPTWRGPGLTPPPRSIPNPPPSPSPLPPAPSPIDPQEFAAILYGKDIPVAVGSILQVGGRIIEGPVETVIGGERTISMIVGYYIPANYWDNTRTVTELWFRGQKAWTLSGGATLSGLNVGGATIATEQRVRFTTGTLAQTADSWSIARNGATSAVAYVPLVTATFENIRTLQFGDIIPFTSVTVEDTAYATPGDQVPWSDILEAFARYDGRPTDEFETADLTRGVEALILGSKIHFPELLSGLRRIKPYWHIRTEDKLYVVEKGPYSLDLTVSMPKVVGRGPDPVTFHLADQSDRNREVLLSYLDKDRDYETNTVRAVMDRDPVQITDAYKSDSVNVPVVSTADEMIVDANLALYAEEMAREQSELTGTCNYLGLQPGDTLLIPTDERNFYHALTEVVRKANFTVDAKAEAFLTCAVEVTTDGFLVVGANNGSLVLDDDSVVSTSNNGISWTERTSGFEAYFLSVATSGSLFVAVGGDTTTVGPTASETKIATSPTGVSWTSRNPPLATESVLYDVVWSGTQFVAVGVDYNNDVITAFPHFGLVGTSPDGVTWTQRTLSADEYELYGVTFASSTYVAVGQDWDATVDCAIFTSSDAITWTKRTASITGVESWLNDVAWSGTNFIAVGYNDDANEAIIMTSPTGVTWTTRTNAAAGNIELNGVHCAGGLCVAVGRTVSASTPHIWTSSDNGVTWTARTPAPSANAVLENVVKDGDMWCAVGGFGTAPIIMTSFDGTTWVQRTPAPASDAYFFGVVGR